MTAAPLPAPRHDIVTRLTNLDMALRFSQREGRLDETASAMADLIQIHKIAALRGRQPDHLTDGRILALVPSMSPAALASRVTAPRPRRAPESPAAGGSPVQREMPFFAAVPGGGRGRRKPMSQDARAWLGMLREQGRRAAAVEGWTKGTLRVWLELAGHMSYEQASAYPSLHCLAAEAGVSQSTVQRALRVFRADPDPIVQVQHRGRVMQGRGGWKSNLYHVDEAALVRRAGGAEYGAPLPLRRRRNDHPPVSVARHRFTPPNPPEIQQPAPPAAPPPQPSPRENDHPTEPSRSHPSVGKSSDPAAAAAKAEALATIRAFVRGARAAQESTPAPPPPASCRGRPGTRPVEGIPALEVDRAGARADEPSPEERGRQGRDRPCQPDGREVSTVARAGSEAPRTETGAVPRLLSEVAAELTDGWWDHRGPKGGGR